MTYEQVNQVEDALREAQNKVEEAGRLLCNEAGDTVGGQMWRDCNALSEKISDVIHVAYKLATED